jgi:hypothetical protein
MGNKKPASWAGLSVKILVIKTVEDAVKVFVLARLGADYS